MRDQLSRYASQAAEFACDATTSLSSTLRGSELNFVPEQGGIYWRIKTPTAILAKLRFRPVNDFIGIRVLALHSGVLTNTLTLVSAWAQKFYLVERLRQDKYTKPARGGYRAFHVDYEIRDMNRWGLPPGTTVELQLTTWLQNLHSELSHRLLYKNTSAKSSSIIIKLEEMSTLLYETDARVAAQYASLFGVPSS